MRFRADALRDFTYLRRRTRHYANMLAVLLAVVFFASGLITSYAEGKDVSGCITDITVSKSPAENREKLTVTVSFSDNDGNESVIRSGDSFTVSWPSQGDAYLTGYRGTIPLISGDGITYGEVTVGSGSAVAVFNDNVEGMYDVSGSFHFDVMAVNNSGGGDENVAAVTIEAGDKSCDVEIHRNASGNTQVGELPEFRKEAADIGGAWVKIDGVDGWVMTLDPEDPTYTRWILTANEHRNSISSDIVIDDQIQQGQELDPAEVSLYSAGSINANYSGTWDEVTSDFTADHPGSALNISDTGRIEWTIASGDADHEAWYLIYSCRITDFTLDTFDNSADITWTDDQGHTYSGHDESRFANTERGGEADVLPRGVLQITKKVAGTDLTVGGIGFEADKLNDSGEWERIAVMTTDNRGRATLTRLRAGHYRLYETSVPDYLEMRYTPEDPYEFDLGEDEGMSMSHGFTCEDPVRKTDITAVKQWKNADGSDDDSDHPTIWFRLYRMDRYGRRAPYGEIKDLPARITEVTWENLPANDVYGNEYVYEVIETDKSGNDWVPEGYTKSESGLTVINTRDEAVTPELPETGGPGDRGYIITGASALLTALGIIVVKVLLL